MGDKGKGEKIDERGDRGKERSERVKDVHL